MCLCVVTAKSLKNKYTYIYTFLYTDVTAESNLLRSLNGLVEHDSTWSKKVSPTSLQIFYIILVFQIAQYILTLSLQKIDLNLKFTLKAYINANFSKTASFTNIANIRLISCTSRKYKIESVISQAILSKLRVERSGIVCIEFSSLATEG